MNNKMFQKSVSLAMSMLLATSGMVCSQEHVVRAETYVKNNILQISNPVEGGQNDNWTGNYIYFGNYPQSSNGQGGYNNDPIKWRVLDNNNAQYVGDPIDARINSTILETNNGFKFDSGLGNGKGGRQNAPVGGNAILLMSDAILNHVSNYHDDYESGHMEKVSWSTIINEPNKKGSALWAWLNDYDKDSVYNYATRRLADNKFIGQAFTDTEKNAIMETMVYTEDLYDHRGSATTYHDSPVTTLSKDKLFIPSYNEILNTKYGFSGSTGDTNTRVLTNTAYSANSHNDVLNEYWLRSRVYIQGEDGADVTTSASYVKNKTGSQQPADDSVGGVEHSIGVDRYEPGCVPALNLNQSSVIFASVADETTGDTGAKSSNVNAVPQSFNLPTGYNNEYKLTMQGDHDNFSVTSKPDSLTIEPGEVIRLNYTGANSGLNEYVSMILTQENEINGISYDEVKYYGKLVEVNSSSLANGTATIQLPNNIPLGNYKLKIFAEQCNGDKKTDWASATQDINLTIARSISVNDFAVSPIAHRVGYEQEVNARLSGENFDIANKLVVEFIDESGTQMFARETGISTGETQKTITFSANEMSSLPTGHYDIKATFYDSSDDVVNQFTCPDEYHVVGGQTISDIERNPSFLQLPFDSATIKVKFKLNGLEEGDTIVSGAAIFMNAAGDEITSSQAIVPNDLQPYECLVNDLQLGKLEAGSYKIKGIMNFNHHGLINQSDVVERDFEILPEVTPEPTPTPTPEPPTPSPNGGNGGSFSWNVIDNDTSVTPTETTQIEKIETKTLKDIQKQVPQTLKSNAYVVGYGDGTFKPENNITRAEAAQMIYKLIYNGTKVNYDVLKKFSDVNQTDWYSTALAYLADQGLIDGDGGKFYPNRQITRAEMSKILYNALLKYDKDQDKKLVYGTNSFNFTDIANNWSFEPIKQLATNNMIDGYGNDLFKPNQNITRAESVAIIAKVFDRSQEFSQRLSFKDVLQSHWAYKYIMNAVNGEK